MKFSHSHTWIYRGPSDVLHAERLDIDKTFVCHSIWYIPWGYCARMCNVCALHPTTQTRSSSSHRTYRTNAYSHWRFSDTLYSSSLFATVYVSAPSASICIRYRLPRHFRHCRGHSLHLAHFPRLNHLDSRWVVHFLNQSHLEIILNQYRFIHFLDSTLPDNCSTLIGLISTIISSMVLLFSLLSEGHRTITGSCLLVLTNELRNSSRTVFDFLNKSWKASVVVQQEWHTLFGNGSASEI